MICGRHSVLKRGCSTWDPKRVPQAEFEGRVEVVRKEMARRNVDALMIYGDNYCFGDLCYLTNYFPKVRGGIALVPRQGAISLLLNIGSRDVPFAKTLTWIDDVRASNQIGGDGAKLLKERGFDAAKVGLIDSGRGFPLPQFEELTAALPRVEWTPCDALIASLRRVKKPLELAAIREAGRVLSEIYRDARNYIEPGRKEYEIVADIDRLARDKGAEDIRILAGAGRLQPPSFKQSAILGTHWGLYLALQRERYWAEACRTFVLTDDAKIASAYERARQALERIADRLRPGGDVAAIEATARQQLGEFYAAASQYGLGHGIGLNQWEAPFLSANDARDAGAPAPGAAELNEGMTMTLSVAFETEGKLIICGSSYEVTGSGPKSLVEI